MRLVREQHNPLFRQYSNHQFSDKLRGIAEILDEHPETADWAMSDLSRGKDPRGARGMTAEEVLRAAIVMQLQELTYKELEFHIADSQSIRAFVRVPDGVTYSDSTLQTNIKAISTETWQKVHFLTVRLAQEKELESGRTVRMDATAVETNIAHPLDSKLLVDCLRVISRTVHWMQQQGLAVSMRYSHKKGRKAFLAILDSKSEDERKVNYHALVVGAGDVWHQLPRFIEACEGLSEQQVGREKRINVLKRIRPLLEGVIAQTISRVFDGNQVHAGEKIVSVFEDHSDVIVKGGRETEFGHKVFFTTGKSNLVIDCEVTEGNPRDSDKFLDLLDRVAQIYGKYPRQTTCDGGFASEENVDEAKERGVKDVCFSKRCGLEPEDMCKSEAVFKKLAKLRAGIESNISALKRAFGLKRVLWRGIEGFRSYVWSAVVAYNFSIMCR